jgi:hypothetical protein
VFEQCANGWLKVTYQSGPRSHKEETVTDIPIGILRMVLETILGARGAAPRQLVVLAGISLNHLLLSSN